MKQLKERSKRNHPVPPKAKWKLRILMLLGFIVGVLYAIDPATLPASARNQQATRLFYKYRDRIALQLPEIIRPASVRAPSAPATVTPGQGYAPTDRNKMEELINKN